MEGLPELELREEHTVSLRFILENVAVRQKKIENRLHLTILKTGANAENGENTLVRQKNRPGRGGLIHPSSRRRRISRQSAEGGSALFQQL